MLVVIPAIGGLIAFISSATEGRVFDAILVALIAVPAITFGVLYAARPVAARGDKDDR